MPLRINIHFFQEQLKKVISKRNKTTSQNMEIFATLFSYKEQKGQNCWFSGFSSYSVPERLTKCEYYVRHKRLCGRISPTE